MFFVHIYEHKDKLLLNLAAKMCEQPFGIQIVDSVIALFGAQNFSRGGEFGENKIVDSVIALFGAQNFSGGGEFGENELPTSMPNTLGKVVYIDTKGYLGTGWFFVHIYEHKDKLLLNLAAKMCEQPFGNQIVDSMIALFGAENFSGGGELAENELPTSMPNTLGKVAYIDTEGCLGIG
ncbi:Meiotic recombination protein dmc1 [Orobanche gracilis]